jgi:hypothetical protein
MKYTGELLTLETGKRHQIELELYYFEVELVGVDPRDARSLDDRYTLVGRGPDASYRQEKSVLDDAVPGDDKVTLRFTHLWPGLRYSLEIDLGVDGRYVLFEDVAWDDLMQAKFSEPEPYDDTPHDEERVRFVEACPGAGEYDDTDDHAPGKGAA